MLTSTSNTTEPHQPVLPHHNLTLAQAPHSLPLFPSLLLLLEPEPHPQRRAQLLVIHRQQRC
jgi:hypothetical protein